LDIGANVGLYALFATVIPSIERIIAFEANRETARELRANIQLNELGRRVAVDERAVSDAPGMLTFGVVSKFSGANSVVDTSIHEPAAFHKKVSVETITVDQFVAENSCPDPLCLKIDVEGHEPQVIAGAADTLRNSQAVIQVEAYGGRNGQVATELSRLGYPCLTTIGPDSYFTNMEALHTPSLVLQLYEQSLQQLILYNHRNKVVMVKVGDFAIQLTGKTGDLARILAKRLIGKRL
jgi:FkbM family methyltransferase